MLSSGKRAAPALRVALLVHPCRAAAQPAGRGGGPVEAVRGAGPSPGPRSVTVPGRCPRGDGAAAAAPSGTPRRNSRAPEPFRPRCPAGPLGPRGALSRPPPESTIKGSAPSPPRTSRRSRRTPAGSAAWRAPSTGRPLGHPGRLQAPPGGHQVDASRAERGPPGGHHQGVGLRALPGRPRVGRGGAPMRTPSREAPIGRSHPRGAPSRGRPTGPPWTPPGPRGGHQCGSLPGGHGAAPRALGGHQ